MLNRKHLTYFSFLLLATLFFSFDAADSTTLEIQHKAADQYVKRADKEFNEKNYDLALDDYYRALYFGPTRGEFHYRIAEIYKIKGKTSEAIQQYITTLDYRPSFIPAADSLGELYITQDKLADAIGIYFKTFAANPKFSTSSYPISYEEALKTPFDPDRFDETTLLKNAINDEAIDKANVYIYTDGTISDTLFASRYLPLLEKKGAVVSIKPQKEVEGLFKSIPDIHIIPQNVLDDSIPFKFKASLSSLPFIFYKNKIDTIPGRNGYLSPSNPNEYNEWIASKTPPMRIGIAWQSSDPKKNIPLSAFLQFSNKNVDLYALQEAHNRDEWLANASKLDITDLIGGDDTLDNVASAISKLDLVITNDSDIAYLSGALGKKTYVILPKETNWFWGKTETTPWYANTTLFHQTEPDSWTQPITDLLKNIPDK